MWGKIWKNNRILRDTTVTITAEDTRTHKVFQALDAICLELDLEHPLWLDSCVREFKKHSSARFRQDSFIEHIDFDCLEIQILEE